MRGRHVDGMGVKGKAWRQEGRQGFAHVLAVEPSSLGRAEEELRTVRAGSRVSHLQRQEAMQRMRRPADTDNRGAGVRKKYT